jgi:hypothetical protein
MSADRSRSSLEILQGQLKPDCPALLDITNRFHGERRNASSILLPAECRVWQVPSRLSFAWGRTAPTLALPGTLQAKFEREFSEDLSGVRIRLSRETRQLGARALTLRNDIFFDPAEYPPTNPRGETLLAEQLAHVIQQRNGRIPELPGSGFVIVTGAPKDVSVRHSASPFGSPRRRPGQWDATLQLMEDKRAEQRRLKDEKKRREQSQADRNAFNAVRYETTDKKDAKSKGDAAREIKNNLAHGTGSGGSPIHPGTRQKLKKIRDSAAAHEEEPKERGGSEGRAAPNTNKAHKPSLEQTVEQKKRATSYAKNSGAGKTTQEKVAYYVEYMLKYSNLGKSIETYENWATSVDWG